VVRSNRVARKRPAESNGTPGFWFLVCYVATQPATPLHQRRIQVVRSNTVARKRLTESNGTPAMDFGCKETSIQKRRIEQNTQTQGEFRWINVSVCTIINF